MRKIIQSDAPESFRNWTKQKPKTLDENQWFQELYIQQKWDIVSDLREKNTKDQFYLCAYCCSRITGESGDTVNEHIVARAIAPRRSLEPKNIVASCTKRNQCDDSHKSQSFTLTPLMDECETELKFKISGRVEGLTQRALETIKVLNLGDNERNNKCLVEKRKQLSQSLMWSNGIDPSDGLEDEELLLAVIDDLLTPVDGKLEAFSPVVANILRNWITA